MSAGDESHSDDSPQYKRMTPKSIGLKIYKDNLVNANTYLRHNSMITRTFIEPVRVDLSDGLEKKTEEDSNHGPFLPLKKKDRKYTLVLDMDETLIHYPDVPETEHDKY